MQAFDELKKKIKDIETQSLAMDGCSPSFSVNDILSIIDSVGKDIDVTTTDTISRQAAIDLVKDVCEAILSMCGSHYDGEAEVYDDVREVYAILKCNKEIRAALRHMSSAQPEKVKCKKCRYVYYDKEFGNYWCNRKPDSFMVEEDGYCKWGK